MKIILIAGLVTAIVISDAFSKPSDSTIAEELTYYENKLTETNFGKVKSAPSAMSRCWCQGGCFFDSGDSYHYRKVVDVDCSIDLKEKKAKVVKELMSHYHDSHGTQNAFEILNKLNIKRG